MCTAAAFSLFLPIISHHCFVLHRLLVYRVGEWVLKKKRDDVVIYCWLMLINSFTSFHSLSTLMHILWGNIIRFESPDISIIDVITSYFVEMCLCERALGWQERRSSHETITKTLLKYKIDLKHFSSAIHWKSNSESKDKEKCRSERWSRKEGITCS